MAVLYGAGRFLERWGTTYVRSDISNASGKTAGCPPLAVRIRRANQAGPRQHHRYQLRYLLANREDGIHFQSERRPPASTLGSGAWALIQFIDQTWLRQPLKGGGSQLGYGKYADAHLTKSPSQSVYFLYYSSLLSPTPLLLTSLLTLLVTILLTPFSDITSPREQAPH